MIKAGDTVKVEDIGPLAEVIAVDGSNAYLELDGEEFWCPVRILSNIGRAA